MPIMYFCNYCNEDMDGPLQHRFENLRGTVGIEIIPLDGRMPIPYEQRLICSDCILNMWFSAIERSDNPQLKEMRSRLKSVEFREKALAEGEQDVRLKKSELERQLEMLDEDKEAIKKQAEELAKTDLNQKQQIIETMKRQHEEELRKVRHQAFQEGLDSKDEVYREALSINQSRRGM